MPTKNAIRAEKFKVIGLARKDAFRKIGEAIRDYHSGRDSQFQIKGKIVQDKELSSRMYGPKFVTQQWERTTKDKPDTRS